MPDPPYIDLEPAKLSASLGKVEFASDPGHNRDSAEPTACILHEHGRAVGVGRQDRDGLKHARDLAGRHVGPHSATLA